MEERIMRLFLVLIASVTFPVFCGRIQAQTMLPDPTLTPGVALDVTSTTVCVPGYAKTVRNVPQSEKIAVYREYGITMYKGIGKDYEVDHLISLELGGSNDMKNLWPERYEPRPGAHEKDFVENFLHREVCAGRLPLKEAQKEISTDWWAVYQKVRREP